MTTTRDAFEAWAASIHIDTAKDQDAWGNRIYKHAHVDSMWFSWQAATLAERDKRQPLTNEQIDAVWPSPEGTNSIRALARAIENAHGIKPNERRNVMTSALNADQTVAVDFDYFWRPMDSCPRGVKCQLLGAGGVAVYSTWDGKDAFWKGWAPLPRRQTL